MKTFEVEIELDTFVTRVKAKNITEARKKALAKLKKKNPVGLISKSFPKNRRKIWVDEM